jgi:aspartate/methionine/tyrosine aminotransferase
VLTASTSEAYAHLFRLLAEPGEALLAPRPSYPLFEPLARLEGVALEHYRLVWEGAWHLDVASLEQAAVTRPRAAIVVQPNNPTGTCLANDEIAALEEWCSRHGAALIADEVFSDFRRPPGTRPLPSLLGEARRVPTFVLGGLSKSCGLPQLKLAWIVAAGPDAARRRALRGLEWIADLFLSVASPVQLALPALLAGRAAFQLRVRERLAANLAHVAGLLQRRPEIAALPAQGGWAQVLRLPRTRSDEEWALELLRREVLVHPGHFYDFEEEGCLVVSLLPETEAFAEGVRRLAALVGER